MLIMLLCVVQVEWRCIMRDTDKFDLPKLCIPIKIFIRFVQGPYIENTKLKSNIAVTFGAVCLILKLNIIYVMNGSIVQDISFYQIDYQRVSI